MMGMKDVKEFTSSMKDVGQLLKVFIANQEAQLNELKAIKEDIRLIRESGEAPKNG